MRRAVVALVVFVWLAAPAFAQKRGLLPQDYYKEVTVSDVAVSPAGTFVAFTVTINVERANNRHREIWLQRMREGECVGPAFRFTPAVMDASRPRWSPDGSTIAFTAQRTGDFNTTWFATVTPVPGEPHHVAGVDAMPVWSPDGKWIAYTKQAGDSGSGHARKGWVASNALSDTLDAERFDGRVVTTSRYKRDGTIELLADPVARPREQLYVVPASGGTPKQLTSLTFDLADVTWSRDSRFLLFSGDERQDDEYSTVTSEDVFIIAREGGKPSAITGNPGADHSPAWSPVADRLLFISQQSPSAKPNVLVANLSPDGHLSGQVRNLTAAWDYSPFAPFWCADGKTIRFQAEIHGSVHLFEVDADGGPIRQVTRGARTVSSVSMSADGQLLAFAADTAIAPTELFVADGEGQHEQRATSFNDDWLDGIDRVAPWRLTWRVADGTMIEGWLLKPIGFRPDRKYPLVLDIHGGPHGQYGHSWSSSFHILSNAGMFVLYCNPRGSTGYGHRFAYATRGRWGEMDSEDLMKGLDTAIARYPQIDSHRLGVSGGSYGGFMTNWLTATTKRFAAAVSSRSIANWESWYGTSDSQGLTEYEFYGPPWEQRDLYRRLSPISYVERVTAPTLILEGENDYRTPIAEGEQWFMALKKRRVPVELVRYPRSSHGLSRTGEPWLLVDRLERIRSWFVRWLVDSSKASTN